MRTLLAHEGEKVAVGLYGGSFPVGSSRQAENFSNRSANRPGVHAFSLSLVQGFPPGECSLETSCETTRRDETTGISSSILDLPIFDLSSKEVDRGAAGSTRCLLVVGSFDRSTHERNETKRNETDEQQGGRRKRWRGGGREGGGRRRNWPLGQRRNDAAAERPCAQTCARVRAPHTRPPYGHTARCVSRECVNRRGSPLYWKMSVAGGTKETRRV